MIVKELIRFWFIVETNNGVSVGLCNCEHIVEMCPCMSIDDEWLSRDDQALV